MRLDQFKLHNFFGSISHDAIPKHFSNQLKLNFLSAQLKCHIKQQLAKTSESEAKVSFQHLSV